MAEAAHGPSHITPMAAPWSTAIAMGTTAPQTSSTISTTAARMHLMALRSSHGTSPHYSRPPRIRWSGPGVWTSPGARPLVSPPLTLPFGAGSILASMERGLFIGEVATRSGVSRKALRLYEARGILPAPRRTTSGYRVYPPDVLGVLHFVVRAQRLGLTLSEIAAIVALRCAKAGPCVHVRALLERKIADLDAMRRELSSILDSWATSSRQPGVVCQHIEREGGDPSWSESRFARRVNTVRKSSWKATPSASARTTTSSSSRRRNGTSS